MRSFLAALQFLTVCPWPKRADRSGDEIGQASIFFPLVGFGLGLILLLVNLLLELYFPSGLLSVALVTVLILLTRGLHLDGLGDTFDGLGAGGDQENVLRVMDDSHTGVFGLLAIVLVILFKIRAIEVMSEERWRALLIAPLLGRWAMVLLAYRAKAAKEGLGSILIGHMDGKFLFLGTLMTLALAGGFSGAMGIGLMAWIFIFTIVCKSYLHRRLGGVTGDTFGAVGELSETSALVLFALVQ
ncbi:MAG: adenosylcobinamide-GDP ribazoletransferase [Deltaproteobacteria bacterium]|nr:adenosylcobinamide-GDP ribazoletransferase [Deltaproteobacteria bacterium]